ncbi:MAG: response regulator [Chloroflexi bacterium]|nr:MAG: response regulator [Chloroflexota bacterium]
MPTILVLDDDEIILDLLKTVLGDAGYETILAPEVSRIPPKASADLVITDLVLSRAYRREEALAWVTTLRKRFGGSPLLIVTAHAPAMDERDMLGANGVVTKPFDVEALLAKVDDLLTYMRKTP